MGKLFSKDFMVPSLIMFLLIYGTFSYCFHFFISGVASHLLLVLLAAFSLLFYRQSLLHDKIVKVFSVMLLYNIILYLVGFTFIQDSLYLSFYISFFVMTMTFSVFYYFTTHILETLAMLGMIVKYIIPIYTIVLLFNFFIMPSAMMYDKFYLSFFPMLYLFLPFVSKKMFWVSLAFSFLVIMREADYRALVLLNLFGIIMYVMAVQKHLFKRRLLRVLAYVFIALPFFFIILSVTAGVNPFSLLDGSVFSSFTLGDETIEMAGDSRSYFYTEIYNHLCKYNALIWGTTPGIGYHTSLADSSAGFYEMLKGGRLDTEVGILEFFHYGGLLNVSLLLAFFWTFIKKVFKKSRNRFAYVVCVYVAFRWFFLFMEGDIIMYMQWISLFVVMALFNNESLLNMTDAELAATIKYHMKKGLGK